MSLAWSERHFAAASQEVFGCSFCAAGKKSRGRACASWDLLSRALSLRPEFTLLCRAKQTQSQPCSSVLGLAWHSMPITISWGSLGFAFCSGSQADSGSRSSAFTTGERRRQNPCTRPVHRLGSFGGLCPFLPLNPVPHPSFHILEEDGI